MKARQTDTYCPLKKAEKTTDQIFKYIRDKLRSKYSAQKPLRAFHAKSIGLVKAEITVNHSIEEDLRVGLFKDPKTYKAWIRFSNASADIEPDREKAIRGMAIKIIGLETESFYEDADGTKCHDIILSNAPIFFPGYRSIAYAGVKVALGNWWETLVGLARVFIDHGFKLKGFLKLPIQTANVLEEAYYSASPYAFGNHQNIKWCAIPLKTIVSVMPPEADENFLKQQLIQDIATAHDHVVLSEKGAVDFELCVQLQGNPREEPIDDTSVEWKNAFRPVATIQICRERIDTDKRKQEDDLINFSPGNAIADHKPRGSINFIRAKVYQELARERSAWSKGKPQKKLQW